MSSSSLAFLNSFTLEEKQNRTPGDSYIVKPWLDEGKGGTIPSEVKNQDKNPLEDWWQKKLLLKLLGEILKRKTRPFLKLCSAASALNTKQNGSRLPWVTCDGNVLILGKVNRPPSFPLQPVGTTTNAQQFRGRHVRETAHTLASDTPGNWTALLTDSRRAGSCSPSDLHGPPTALEHCAVFLSLLIPYLPPTPHCNFLRCSGHFPPCSQMDSNRGRTTVFYLSNML